MNTASLKAFLTPPIIIGTTTVIAVISVALAFVMTKPSGAASYATAARANIAEEVSTTGTVKAAQEVALSFQTSGRIASIHAGVGSHVGEGTLLSSLSVASQQAALEQAQAALQAQQAKLSALQIGARPEDVAVSQTAVTGAQASLTQAEQSLLSAAQDAYVKSDDAIHNRVDQFFSNPRTANPTLSFSLSDSGLQNVITGSRVQMETLLTQWQSYVSSLPQNPDDATISQIAETTQANLSRVSAYLDLTAGGLTKVIPNTTYPASSIQSFQTSVATGRSNISTVVGEMNAAQTGVTTAESSLASAQSQLTLKQAPATAQDLQAQQAQVASAQANVDAAEANLSNAIIRAPFGGTITKNDAQLGETVAPGQQLISMVSDAQFQFETYVSQADLAKLKMGNTALVSLDAYENQSPLQAHVVSIDLASTVQNGVSSYKVTLQFDQSDPRIFAGLTGSAKITTQSKTGVIAVPTSAIITRGAEHFVLKNDSSGERQIQVQTGIEGGGMTEIVSGLSEGDHVRSFGTQ